MTTDIDDIAVADLQRLMAEGDKVVVIVGSGVSVGATKNAETASWTGLIEHGVKQCVALNLKDQPWAERQLAHLSSGDTDELIFVAEAVSTALNAPSGGDFRAWFRSTVGSLAAVDNSVLEALSGLGVQLATTNYDGLLESVTGLPVVTWREFQKVERVIRGREQAVLHLHGFWEQPESIVFGSRSYDDVVRDEGAQAVLRTLLMSKTLVYVGFGAGLEDPNFTQFREWAGRVLGESEYRHYRLVRKGERQQLQARHPSQERISVISFGESHDDLAPFLRSLAPPALPGQSQHSDDQIWNVPHRRNPDLVGRDDKVAEVARQLEESKAAVVQANAAIQTIHGLGGIGKTQLAVEYAYRNRSEYGLIWWIRSADRPTLISDFSDLGEQLGIKAENYERQQILISAIHRALAGFGRPWLLVYDNAESFQSIESFVPSSPGHVLITTRSRDWPPAFRPIALDVLSPEEAIGLLESQTGLEDESGAIALAQELGYLPLALVQAAAYIRQTGLSFAGYMDRYQRRHADLLNRGQPRDYPATVATTWELSFQAAIEKDSHSEVLMNVLAFMASEAIPLDLIAKAATELPPLLGELFGDEVVLDDAIVALREYSLVERESDTDLSMHRLVQMVTRDRLTDSDRRVWAAHAVAVVGAALPKDAHDVRFSADASRLFTHANMVSSLAREFQISSAALEQLLNRLGRYLTGRAGYVEALRLFEEALEVATTVHGAESPEAAMNLNDQAVVLHHMGELQDARSVGERALAIQEGLLGAKHPDTATSLGNLANVSRSQTELRQARDLEERALTIREEVLGPKHPYTAASLANLAAILEAQGDLETARSLEERALAIREEVLGPKHPDTAASLGGLSLILYAEGDLKTAKELNERALAIREEVFGPKHPDTTKSLGNLAMTLQAQDDELRTANEFTLARATYQQALPMFRRINAGEETQATLKRISELNALERSLHKPKR